MAIETLHTISFAELPAQIRKIASTFTEAELKSGFMSDASEIIEKEIESSFASASDADGNKWLSSAPNTKFGGRFSVNYKKRPSGATVTSGSIRLSDTGQLKNSIKKTVHTGLRLVYKITGGRNEVISEAAAKWGNKLGGFGDKQKKLIDDLMIKYLRKKAVE